MINRLHAFFDDLETAFPYWTMREDFKGHHAIYQDDDGSLKLLLWYNGRAYRISLDADYNTELTKIIKSETSHKNKHIKVLIDKMGRFKKNLTNK